MRARSLRMASASSRPHLAPVMSMRSLPGSGRRPRRPRWRRASRSPAQYSSPGRAAWLSGSPRWRQRLRVLQVSSRRWRRGGGAGRDGGGFADGNARDKMNWRSKTEGTEKSHKTTNLGYPHQGQEFSGHAAELRKHPQVARGPASFGCGAHQAFPQVISSARSRL
jgi:hypothetical protein